MIFILSIFEWPLKTCFTVIKNYFIVFLSLKINFVLANSADLDEMLQYAVFYLRLDCLKYLEVSGPHRIKTIPVKDHT